MVFQFSLISFLILFFIYVNTVLSLNIKSFFSGFPRKNSQISGQVDMSKLIIEENLPSWDSIKQQTSQNSIGLSIIEQDQLRILGEGLPSTNVKLRLFGTNAEPRLTFYRDTAAWCPYCQKVWIFLEEKKIPHKVEKINMRSYGDKPVEFLKMVPNGLLPAIKIDGRIQTESLEIMLNLDRLFSGPNHPSMWPSEVSGEQQRALSLMRLERELFSHWCSLVFRPPLGDTSRSRFERCMDTVDNELKVTSSPWFLNTLSIVDLTYVSHIERMAASVPYWSGFKIRGDGRWPAIERWLAAFEKMPSYMATKSDYYTHVMDIPPQYGPGYSVYGSEKFAQKITGRDGSWKLPLPPLSPLDLEPVSDDINPGDLAAAQEAAYRLAANYEAVAKFALRGAGQEGVKQFQAPLADPYAIPAIEYLDDMKTCLKQVILGLLHGYQHVSPLQFDTTSKPEEIQIVKESLRISLSYFRDRIGVPRDMSYPAARQLRAHINWVIDSLL